jgi:hypothetical protein
MVGTKAILALSFCHFCISLILLIIFMLVLSLCPTLDFACSNNLGV